MRTMIRTILISSLVLSLSGLVWAQAQKKRASPHETTSAMVGGSTITIEYGRPYKKGRDIFGGLEPLGKVWRTGADEATTFTTTKDLMVGNLHVPAGTYGLFTIPDKGKWTLVLNKTAKQWGAFKYEESQDLGRTPMQVKTLDAPVEQLTIVIEPAGTLKIVWDRTEASVSLMAH
jgi:VCBS repeat-containing protein